MSIIDDGSLWVVEKMIDCKEIDLTNSTSVEISVYTCRLNIDPPDRVRQWKVERLFKHGDDHPDKSRVRYFDDPFAAGKQFANYVHHYTKDH